MNCRQQVRESLAQFEQDVQTLQKKIQRSDLLAQLKAMEANLTHMNDKRASLVESMVVTEADMPNKVLRMIFAEARALSTPPNPTILYASHVSR
jgi:cell division septum initiation protein DivIVA